jgi:hypothetical protein
MGNKSYTAVATECIIANEYIVDSTAILNEEEYEIDNDLNAELVNGIKAQLTNYFDKVNIANQQLIKKNIEHQKSDNISKKCGCFEILKKYDKCVKRNNKLNRELKESLKEQDKLSILCFELSKKIKQLEESKICDCNNFVDCKQY